MAESNKKVILNHLEAIYAAYPRKMGKGAGMRKAVVQIKTIEDVELLRLAIANYRAYLQREGTEPKYMLYWSTFLTNWRDWLDPETGTVAEQKLDLKGMGFE